jgi:hypothetical protein
MRSTYLGVGLIILSSLVTGCFLDARLAALTENSEKLESSVTEGALSLSVLTQPSSLAFLGTGTVNLEIGSTFLNTISDLVINTNAACSVAVNGCASSLPSKSTCAFQLTFTAIELNSARCEVQVSYTYEGVSKTETINIDSTVTVPGATSVAKVYPVNGSYWNDYVLNNNSSKDIWNQADAACSLGAVPSNPRHDYCLHGAEHLKVYTGLNSCTGLSITEDLGIFKWKCVVDSGKAYFYSSDIKDGKGLKDLITAAGWKDNRVHILKNATEILTSPLAKWWENSVVSLPTNATEPGKILSNDGNGKGIIYYFDSDRTVRAYRPTSKSALVALSGAKLKPLDATATEATCVNFFGNGSCILDLTNTNYIWAEVNIEYTTTSAPKWAIYLHNTYVSKIMNTGISGRTTTMGEAAIYSDASQFVISRNISLASFNYGIYLDASSDNFLLEGAIIKSSTNGSEVDSFNDNVIFRNVFVLNSQVGISINDSSTNGVYQGISTFNLAYGNRFFGGAGGENVMSSVAVVNSGLNNLNASIQVSSSNVTLSNIAITNSTYGISIGTSVKFSGVLLMGSNTTNCYASAANLGIVNSTCADSYTDGASGYGASQSNAVLRIGKTAATSFNGRVTTNDVKNTVDTTGLVGFASLIPSVMDLFDFALRGWGKEGTSNIDSAASGRCTAGNCRIYDWRLSATDTTFRNVSNNGSTQNAPFVAGSTCPAAVHGNKVTATLLATSKTFLTNAWEILHDGVGDEDGLCESNEDCLYTPNIGAYQGEGDLSAGSCLFQDGTISGVRIFSYPINVAP